MRYWGPLVKGPREEGGGVVCQSITGLREGPNPHSMGVYLVLGVHTSAAAASVPSGVPC